MTSTLTFVTPPPGFAPHTEFSLADVEGAPGLHTLQAADADIRLFVVEAARYIPDYVPDFTPEQLGGVGVTAPEDADVLVVATLDDEGPVVNLLAPVLVNHATGAAVQVILDGTDWPLRGRLTR